MVMNVRMKKRSYRMSTVSPSSFLLSTPDLCSSRWIRESRSRTTARVRSLFLVLSFLMQVSKCLWGLHQLSHFSK